MTSAIIIAIIIGFCLLALLNYLLSRELQKLADTLSSISRRVVIDMPSDPPNDEQREVAPYTSNDLSRLGCSGEVGVGSRVAAPSEPTGGSR